MGSAGAKASGGWQQVSCGWRHTAAIGDGDGKKLKIGSVISGNFP